MLCESYNVPVHIYLYNNIMIIYVYIHCIQSLFREKCNYEFIKNRLKNVFTVFVVFFELMNIQ